MRSSWLYNSPKRQDKNEQDDLRRFGRRAFQFERVGRDRACVRGHADGPFEFQSAGPVHRQLLRQESTSQPMQRLADEPHTGATTSTRASIAFIGTIAASAAARWRACSAWRLAHWRWARSITRALMSASARAPIARTTSAAIRISASTAPVTSAGSRRHLRAGMPRAGDIPVAGSSLTSARQRFGRQV